MYVVVTGADDPSMGRRARGLITAAVTVVVLVSGSVAPPAGAIGGLLDPITDPVSSALVDPALEGALAGLTGSERVEVAVVLSDVPTLTDLALLESTGAVIGGFDHLPIAAVAGTAAQIEAIAALPGVGRCG